MGVLCLAINQSIWGAPDTWVNGSASEQKAGIKYPAAARDTYREVYNSGLLPWNTIDLSPCFWGIGAGSIWAQPHFIWAWCPEGDVEQFEAAGREVYEPKTISPIFTDGGTASNVTYQYNRRWRYLAGEQQTSSYPLGLAFGRKIYALFNYTDIFIIPYVRCAAADNTHGTANIVQLNTYLSSEYANKPQILGFSFKIRRGDGVDTNRTSEDAGLAFATNMVIPGSSATYDGHKYFASLDGMSLLVESEYQSNGGQTPGGVSRQDKQGDATIGDSTTGFNAEYCTDSSSVKLYYYDEKNPLWEIHKATYVYSNKTRWCYYPRIYCTAENLDDVRDYIMQQFAFIGLPFVVDPSIANRGQIGDLGVYLPKFDTDGVTTGEYEEGAAALRLPNADWTDGRTGSGYDPTRKPGEDDFGDLSNRRPTRVQTGSVNYYVTNYETIYTLQRYLNAQYVPSGADLTADFKGTNPADYIVSIQKYPVALPTAGSSLIPDEDVYIGKINTAIKAFRLPASLQGGADKYLDFGTLTITPYFSSSIDFRDYQSKILLFMPFVGTAELDPKIFIGHTLGLIYNIDYLTGSVAAEIKRDGLTIETRTAKLSQTVPFFAGNMGQYQNEIAQTGFAIEQSKIKQITGAVTTLLSIGGAAATVAGGGSELAGLGSGAGLIRGASNMLLERINQESLEYRLEHTQPQIGTISTASAGNAFLLDDRARVLIWRPYMLPGYDQATYSHVVGHATLRAAALSEFSGLTVAAAAELSNIYTLDGTKSASEQELKLIKQALLAGVYV